MLGNEWLFVQNRVDDSNVCNMMSLFIFRSHIRVSTVTNFAL